MLSKEERKAQATERNRAILDKAMGKLASRRLWVWLVCTFVYFCMSMVYIFTESAISSEVMNHASDKWVEISQVFLAVVGVDNIVQSWRGNNE